MQVYEGNYCWGYYLYKRYFITLFRKQFEKKYKIIPRLKIFFTIKITKELEISYDYIVRVVYFIVKNKKIV